MNAERNVIRSSKATSHKTQRPISNFRPNYAYLSTGQTHPNNKDDLARVTQAISTNVDKFIEKFFINM